MITEMMIGAGAATVGGVAFTRTRRAKLYRELSGRVAAITSTHARFFGAASDSRTCTCRARATNGPRAASVVRSGRTDRRAADVAGIADRAVLG